MISQNTFRSILFGALGLICPLFAGCWTGYAYPTMSFVPTVTLESPVDEIHAFRIDLTDKQNCFDCDAPDRYVFSTIPLTSTGRVPSQTKVALDYGWFFYQSIMSYSEHTHHTVLVRLYRPGWDTVEIKPWEKTNSVIWKKAQDLTAQEKAVDDLISTWKTDLLCCESPCDENCPLLKDREAFRGLVPGSTSDSHRQALMFAASEYDRLALLVTDDDSPQGRRKRLLEKSQWLRDIAGVHPSRNDRCLFSP
jgi:hypothetical protein